MGSLRLSLGRIVLFSLVAAMLASACLAEREGPAGTANGNNIDDVEVGDCSTEGAVRSCRVHIDDENCYVGEQTCSGGTWSTCFTPDGFKTAALSAPAVCGFNPCNPDCQYFDEMGPVTNGSGGPPAPASDCTDAPPAGLGGTWTQIQSTATLTISAVPADGDTVTIGTKTYTFKVSVSGLDDIDGNVLIGISASVTGDNLEAAINLGGTPGTEYALSMTANTEVTALSGGSSPDVEALPGPFPGNLGDTLAVSATGAGFSWSGPTLDGGLSQCEVTDWDCDADGGLGCPANQDCIFNCTGSDECEDCNFDCTDANSCTIACTGNEACEDSTFFCSAQECVIDCQGSEACEDSLIACTGGAGSTCYVKCGPSNDTCEDSEVLCGSDDCYIDCTGSRACAGGVNMAGSTNVLNCFGSHSCDDDDICCGGGSCDINCVGSGSNHVCEHADIFLYNSGSGDILCDGDDACQDSAIRCCGSDCTVECSEGDSDTCQNVRAGGNDAGVCCVSPAPATNCDLSFSPAADTIRNSCTQGDACPGTCPSLPAPPVVGDFTYREEYEATCPAGKGVVWEFLVWDTTCPGVATIDFRVRAGPTDADVGAETFIDVGTATNAAETCWYATGAPCPIDLEAVLGVPNSTWNFLEIEAELKVNGGGVAPSLDNWQITYTCVDNI